MKRRPRDIGTKAETATVRFLQANGFPHAERRSLRGALDAGDITGTPGVCWEVKGGDAARTASDLMIARWMGELDTEMTNAKAKFGVLVVQRSGVGPANAGRWWAWMTAHQFVDLAMELDPDDLTVPHAFPVRMLLADAVTLLRAAGYGEPAEPNACPTCSGPVRETVGMVCQACGTDYSSDRPVVAPHRPTGALTATDVPLPELEATR